jgi:hypothetical protein
MSLSSAPRRAPGDMSRPPGGDDDSYPRTTGKSRKRPSIPVGPGSTFVAVPQGILIGGVVAAIAVWLRPAQVEIVVASCLAVIATLAWAIAVSRTPCIDR